MKQLITKGIVLSRTDYGEADRILTILTPDQGKLRLMARGVRKAKSRLAGGIELFSTTELTYMNGRGEIGTLLSARLIKYYSSIVQNIDRVQLGYGLIKVLHRGTEDQPEAEYFTLLEQAFAALDTMGIELELVRLWFESRMLHLAGHSPNLRTDTAGHKLVEKEVYNFDFEAMAFTPHKSGNFKADHIKTLRLLFDNHQPGTIQLVQGTEALLSDLMPLVHTMLISFIRV